MRAAGRAARSPLTAVILLAALLSGCPRTEMPKLVTFSDPLSAEEHSRLGAIHEQAGNLDRAVTEYTAALKKKPHNLVALTGLGNVLLHQGKPRLAAKYYERALAEEPDNMVVLNNIAMAWTMAGKPKKALPYADRAIELDGGKDPRMLDTRAQARFAAGDRDGALSDLNQAAALCALSGDSDQLSAPCAEIADRYAQINSER